MTPAAELRAAAEKIRNRADVATPGPWKADHREYPERILGAEGNADVVAGSRWGGEANVFDNNNDAYHIALWHPGVAMLIADLLDASASVAATSEWLGSKIEVLLMDELKLARAINETKVA